MKRLCIITLILFTVPLCSFAPSKKINIIDIWETKPICKDIMLEYRKVKILNAIWQVEHPKTQEEAVKAFWREGALGPFQIHKEVVEDVNSLILKEKRYTHQDCKDSTKSVEILVLYHSYWNPKFEYYNVAMVQNGGPTWYKGSLHQKKRLNSYWDKVKMYLK